ncbi:MAG: hypothetical protein QXP31_08605, partial [Pyrobaculum sp.]
GGFIAWMQTDLKTLEYYTHGVYPLKPAYVETVFFCSEIGFKIVLNNGVSEVLKGCLIAFIWPKTRFLNTSLQ